MDFYPGGFWTGKFCDPLDFFSGRLKNEKLISNWILLDGFFPGVFFCPGVLNLNGLLGGSFFFDGLFPS